MQSIAAGYSLNKLEEIYGGEDAKVERALLPDYEAGNILDLPFMPKKVIRISGKSKDGTSKYLNISRFYPGGDILSFEGKNVVPFCQNLYNLLLVLVVTFYFLWLVLIYLENNKNLVEGAELLLKKQQKL